MKNQLEWQERFNIGVEIVDREHRKLFSILNRLLMTGKEGEKSRWACQEGIKYFKDHAIKHFSEEEEYMISIHYEGYETHRRVHDNFRDKLLPALEKELEQSDFSPNAVNHFLGVCAGWLIGHTLTEDHAITGKTKSRWGELLPQQEQAAMQQTIIQLLSDMFQLDTRVVSECYEGERFGQGIYYRLDYENKKQEKWEVLLGFEEKLILNTICSMINVEANTIYDMMKNIVRYMAQQFMNRIKENFPSAESYEIKEEKLLTYEQFHKAFANRTLQFSLLFDTGEGYFAYCSTAPNLLWSEEEIAARAKNTMEEIQKHLKKTEKKKKILVVDDSSVVREAMKNLLGTDYEVSMVDSGLAAIREITLNRPDLILLDYEMPVCDGSQVLEMIRAEKDFADIPVIFLTGRADRESVKKVIALKPAGYLVKTLNPEEIKKGIDTFFETKGSGETNK